MKAKYSHWKVSTGKENRLAEFDFVYSIHCTSFPPVIRQNSSKKNSVDSVRAPFIANKVAYVFYSCG